MAGPHGRGAHDDPQKATEATAIYTARIIAGLRWRLQHQEILEHPKVLSELSQLDQQITEQLATAYRNPGRHRSPAGQVVSQRSGDAPGCELKPNPVIATTPAEFIDALWHYKAWWGSPSWRTMAKQAGQTVVHSTMYQAMKSDALPKWEVVKAIITGCGGGEDDLRSFLGAWRRICALSQAGDVPVPPAVVRD
jgi:hypothetical protein